MKKLSIPKWVLATITDKDRYIIDLCKSRFGVLPVRYECTDEDAVVVIWVYRWVEVN